MKDYWITQAFNLGGLLINSGLLVAPLCEGAWVLVVLHGFFALACAACLLICRDIGPYKQG